MQWRAHLECLKKEARGLNLSGVGSRMGGQASEVTGAGLKDPMGQ